MVVYVKSNVFGKPLTMRQWGGVGRKDFVSKSAFSQYLDLTDIMRPVYLEIRDNFLSFHGNVIAENISESS